MNGLSACPSVCLSVTPLDTPCEMALMGMPLFKVNIGWGNGFVASGIETFSEQMLTQIYVAL